MRFLVLNSRINWTGNIYCTHSFIFHCRLLDCMNWKKKSLKWLQFNELLVVENVFIWIFFVKWSLCRFLVEKYGNRSKYIYESMNLLRVIFCIFPWFCICMKKKLAELIFHIILDNHHASFLKVKVLLALYIWAIIWAINYYYSLPVHTECATSPSEFTRAVCVQT